MAARTRGLALAAGLALGLWSGVTGAGDLVYTPVNPNFGGDPFNGSFLINSAQIQNQFTDDGSQFDSLFDEPTVADDFANAIRSTLIGDAASELSRAIFEDGQQSGQIALDDAIVSFETVGQTVEVTVNDGMTSNRLVIPVPQPGTR